MAGTQLQRHKTKAGDGVRGDFSRDVSDPSRHYTRVLAQQGRVLLDSDVNAQSAMHLHYLRALARDLIGPHGGPAANPGFGLRLPDGANPKTFVITAGHYYVAGILCENPADIPYTWQPTWYHVDEKLDGPMLVYLDVWERFVGSHQDAAIREPALGGPDTSGRAQVVWQVRTHPFEGDQVDDVLALLAGDPPTMAATASGSLLDDTPCLADPDAAYRGPENQLYRVEIHRGGAAGEATFTWSRDNAAVAVFPVVQAFDGGVVLEHLGRDDRGGLAEGQWVELCDDDLEYRGQRLDLCQVESVDAATNTVRVTGSFSAAPPHPTANRVLRRWDHDGDPAVGGGIAVAAGDWVPLEDGIGVRFSAGGEYRPGMYWTIPARADTGTILWRQGAEAPAGPAAERPHGVRHHLAPLARINVTGGVVAIEVSYRREFRDLCDLTPKV